MTHGENNILRIEHTLAALRPESIKAELETGD